MVLDLQNFILEARYVREGPRGRGPGVEELFEIPTARPRRPKPEVGVLLTIYPPVVRIESGHEVGHSLVNGEEVWIVIYDQHLGAAIATLSKVGTIQEVVPFP